MRFQELADIALSSAKGKRDLLIIIPYYAEYDILARHLDLLDRQSWKEFDAIIVAEGDSDAAKVAGLAKSGRFGFGIVVVKRKENSGSAGGYFTGQKYALENGYGCVIMADTDCMPEDPGLVKALYENRDRGFVSPTVYGNKDGIRTKFEIPSVNHYSLVSRGIMEEYGLYYAPLYYYAEGGEYAERIRQPRATVENYATHPFKIGEEFVKMDKTWYTLLNTIHMMKFETILPYLAFLNAMAMALAFFVFGSRKAREYAVRSFSLLMSFKYGKEAIGAIRGIGPLETVPKESLPEGVMHADMRSGNYALSSRRGKIASMAHSALSWAGRDVAVDETYSFSGIVLRGIFSRRTFVRNGDAYIPLFDNSNPIMHAIRLALFAVAFFPFVGLMSLAYIPIKLVRMPKTLGYGLD